MSQPSLPVARPFLLFVGLFTFGFGTLPIGYLVGTMTQQEGFAYVSVFACVAVALGLCLNQLRTIDPLPGRGRLRAAVAAMSYVAGWLLLLGFGSIFASRSGR